jgi:organic radical activating enzyme
MKLTKNLQPRLTIIIPVYNSYSQKENLIKIFKKIEKLNYGANIILSDDGSTEKRSISLYKKLIKNSKNNKLVKSNINHGPGIARNKCIEHSAEWIIFLDHDDDFSEVVLIDIIEKIAAYEFKNNDLIVHSDQKKFLNKDTLLNDLIYFKTNHRLKDYIFNKKMIVQNQITFSKGFIEDVPFIIEVVDKCKNLKIITKDITFRKEIKNSIMNNLSPNIIEGYMLSHSKILKQYKRRINIEKFNVAIFGVCLMHISKMTIENFNKSIEILSKHYLDIKISFENINENYSRNFELSLFYFDQYYNNKINAKSLFSKIKKVFNTFLSCKDLEHSLFFGPDEIRACCKRFFVDGKQKGDVVITKASPKITFKDILKKKENLKNSINNGTNNECDGCPYISRYSKTKNNKINYVSLENFSYCNMRCEYCSPKYYGGQEAKYKTNVILSDCIAKNKIDQNCHYVWGGGEPTLSPYFSEINEKIIKSKKYSKIRILSNSLRYSKLVSSYLKNKKIHLVTSIDAGNNETFKKIRGKGEIDTVFTNLKNYLLVSNYSDQITIKYIISNENADDINLNNFVQKVIKYKLQNCYYQISCDFRFEKIKTNHLYSIYLLASILKKNKINKVFFDDLIRDRLSINSDYENIIIKQFNSENKFLASKNSKFFKKTYLWGEGLQSKWIKNHTSFGKAGGIIDIINNKNILKLKHKIIKENNFIVPAGVQSLPNIVEEIKSKKLEKYIAYPIFI